MDIVINLLRLIPNIFGCFVEYAGSLDMLCGPILDVCSAICGGLGLSGINDLLFGLGNNMQTVFGK